MVVYGSPKRGRLYGVTGSDPVTGSDIAWRVTTDKVWMLKSAVFTMAAGSGSSGTARSPYFQVSGSDGTVYWKVYSGHDYVSGSGVVTYYWIAGLPSETLDTGSAIVVSPLPSGILLDDSMTMGSSTTNIDTADNWSSPTFLVEEYSE